MVLTLQSFPARFTSSFHSWFLIGSLNPLLHCSCRLALNLAFSFFFSLTRVGHFPLRRWTARQPAHHHLPAGCGFGLLGVRFVSFNISTCLTTHTIWQKISEIPQYQSDTFLLLRSTGWRHSGELLRVLFTIEETGWKVKMSLDFSSFKASKDLTCPKSSHLLTSSSPSRIAGILKHNRTVI